MDEIPQDKPAPETNNGAGLGSADNTTPIANGEVPANVILFVRNAPGANNKKVATLTGGTKMSIFQTEMFNGSLWGRMEKGWVALEYVKLDKDLTAAPTPSEKPAEPKVIRLARVINCDQMRLRSQPSMGGDVRGTVPGGYQVEYDEKINNEGFDWYHTRRGWLRGDYLMELGNKTPTVTNNIPGVGPMKPGAPAVIGTIVGAEEVRVRADADINSAELMKLKKGSKVYILGTKENSGHVWYQIQQGYVSSDHISIGNNPTVAGNGGTTEVAKGAYITGVVAAGGVPTYMGPGATYKELKKMPIGQAVTVYEMQMVGNVAWGRIGANQWINLKFVTVNGTGITGTGTTATVNANEHAVRIRPTPSTNLEQAMTIRNGSVVEVLEIQGEWARTPQGWIAKNLLKMNGEVPTPPTAPTVPTVPTTPTTPEAKPDTNRGIPFNMEGTTNKVTDLQMIPGILGDFDAQIEKDENVVITKVDSVDNKVWGLVEGGWVDLANINLKNYVVSESAQIVWQDASSTKAEGAINRGDVVNIQELKIDDAKKVWGKITHDGKNVWIELTQITRLDNYSTNFLLKTNIGTAEATVYAYSDTTSEAAAEKLAAGSPITITAIARDAHDIKKIMVKVDAGWIEVGSVAMHFNAIVKPAMLMTWTTSERTTPHTLYLYNGDVVVVNELGLTSNGVPMAKVSVGSTDYHWVELSNIVTP